MADGKSPIDGKSFEKLSSNYKAKKKDETGDTKANLTLTGDMLDALDFRVTSDGIKVGFFGSEAPKADGHNNLSGKSKLPERRFLPDKGENFTSEIQREVDKIIADKLAERDIPKDELSSVDSKSELYDILGDLFDGMSRGEIKQTVLRSGDWIKALEQYDLLEFL